MSKRKQTFQRPTKIDEDEKNKNESAIFSSNQNFEDQIKPKTIISNITNVGLTNGYHDNKTESFAAINGGHSSPDSAESTDPKQPISNCFTASHDESRGVERNESRYNHVSIPNTNYNALFGSSNDSSFSGSTSNSDNEQSYVPQTADTVNELSTAVTDEKDKEGHSESDEHDVNMTHFSTAHKLHNGNVMNKTDSKTADLNLLPSQTNFVNNSIDHIKTEMEDVVSQNLNLTTCSSTTTFNSPSNNNNNSGMNGKSTFHCAECGFGFTTKSNCDRHMRTKHGYLRRKDMIQSTQYMASNLTLLPTSSITSPSSNKECHVSNHATTKGTNILLLSPVSTNNLTVASTVPKKLGTLTPKTTVALLANSMLHTTTPFAHKEKVFINGEKPMTLSMPSVVNSNGLSPHPQSNLAPKSTNKRKANDLIQVPIGCYTSAVLAHITSITTSCSDKSLVVNKTTTMNLNQKTSEGALPVLNGAHSLVNHLTLLNDGGKENYLSNLTEFSCKLCTTGIENGQASIGSCDLDSIIRHIVLEHENVENILSHIALSNKSPSPPPIQSSNDPIMEPKNRLTDKIILPPPHPNMENENVFIKVTPQNNDNDYTMKNGTDLTNTIRPYPLPHKIMRKKLYHNVSQPSNTDRDHQHSNNNNIDSYNAKHDSEFTNGTELLTHKSRFTPKSNANNSNVNKNNINGLGVDPSLASYFLTFLQQPTLVNGHQEGVAVTKNDKSFATQMVPTFTAFQTYMESLQKAWNIVPSSTSHENENNRDSNKHISANEISGNTTPITDISNLTTTATNNSVPEPLLLLENTEDEEMMPLVIKSESQENDEVDDQNDQEEDYNADVNTPPPSKATVNYKRMSQQQLQHQAMAGGNRYNSVMLTNYSPPSPNASSQITGGGGGGDGMEEITSYHSEHGNEGGNDKEQQQSPHDANNNAMNSFDNNNYHARLPGGYYNTDDGNGIHVNAKLSQVPPPSSTPFFDPRAVPYRTPGPKKFVCVYCQNTYSSRGNVNRHIRNTHFKMKRNGVVGAATSGNNITNYNDDQVTNLLQYSIFKHNNNNNFDGGMNEDEGDGGDGEENVNDSILQEAGNDESCDVTAYITPQTNTLLNGQYCAANIKNGGVDLVAQNGHNGITGNGVYVTSNKRASSSLNPTLQNYTRYMNAANHQQRNSSSALSNSDARNESFANISHNNSGNTSSPAYHKLTPGGLYKNMPGPVPIPAYMLSSLKNATTLPTHIIMEDGGVNGCCKREESSLPSSHDMDTTPLLDPNLVSAFYKNNTNLVGHRATTKSSLVAANHENMNGNGHHNSSAKHHAKTKKVGVGAGNNREKYPKAVTETSLPLLQPKLQNNNATQQPNYASVMEDYYKKYMEMVMGCSSEDNKNQKQNGLDKIHNNPNKNGINNKNTNNNIISNLPYAMLQDFYAQFFNKSTTASNHINNMNQQKDNNTLESSEMENNKENISSKISPQETHISNSPKHHHNISSQHIVEV